MEESCEFRQRGETQLKTKTKFVKETIQKPGYVRKPDEFFNQYQTILHARALIMGRYGMLKCAKNYHNGHGTKLCPECKVLDDEPHRINDCIKWRSVNRYDSDMKIKYDDIFSSDRSKCVEVLKVIISVWDLESGRNEIRN